LYSEREIIQFSAGTGPPRRSDPGHSSGVWGDRSMWLGKTLVMGVRDRFASFPFPCRGGLSQLINGGGQMVKQVPIVAILMIVHGGMQALMGLFLAIAGPTIFALAQAEGENVKADEKTMMSIVSGGYLLYGIIILIVSILYIIAGMRCLKFRGRGLALAALFGNILTLLNCWCLPTSIGMMVLGLIVMFNGDVVKAFAMAESGVSPEEIKRSFDGGRRSFPGDDFDERGEPG
jgi:hypothetical protein